MYVGVISTEGEMPKLQAFRLPAIVLPTKYAVGEPSQRAPS
jgi:hypothetical protein